jgi:uncharacterized UPF0160 family protein
MTIIGSHSGNFHADDVFAVAALSILHPNYQILRSRDPKVWSQCDYLVDVGGVYEHENCIYDHHFRNGPTYNDGLKMSSIGLIWKHYGREICQSQTLADRVCQKIIRTLDAHDNGLTLTQKIEGIPNVNEVSISTIISAMNPPNLKNVDKVFAQEVCKARDILQAYIANAKKWQASREEVLLALKGAGESQYLEVSENCNWMEHLLTADQKKQILFVLYPSDGKWYSRTVSVSKGSFESRKNFPQSWAGLRDDEFSKEAGISDGVFCHHACFICGSYSKESTIKLIQQAIKS